MLVRVVGIVFRICVVLTCLRAFNYTWLINQYTPQPNPYTRFGGNLRKATYSNLIILFVNNLLLLVNDLKQNIRLHRFSGSLFVNIVRPVSIVIGISCWFSILINFPLASWSSGERWTPRWYGHTFYTLPMVAVFLESFLRPHHTDGFVRAFKRSISTQTLFIVFHLALLIAENRNPNLVFVLVWWKQLLTAGGLVLTTLFAVSIGYLIDWAVYGLPEDDENIRRPVSHEREPTDDESDQETRLKTD